MSTQIVQPGQEPFRCLTEATGYCSSSADKLSKALKWTQFSGIKLGNRCTIAASTGEARKIEEEKAQKEKEKQELERLKQEEEKARQHVEELKAQLAELEKQLQGAVEKADVTKVTNEQAFDRRKPPRTNTKLQRKTTRSETRNGKNLKRKKPVARDSQTVTAIAAPRCPKPLARC